MENVQVLESAGLDLSGVRWQKAIEMDDAEIYACLDAVTADELVTEQALDREYFAEGVSMISSVDDSNWGQILLAQACE